MRFLALHAHRTLPGRAPAPLAAFQDDTDYYALRFEGVERLYGPGTLANLAGSHVCVVGLGGVGSWAVEALARSGVGSLTLMDPDEVCISNTNRQTNALRGTVGRSKAKVLAEQLGRKRGPPRFGHSSADQAAPAPERVPGADEARPAWANQPLGPYNNAGQPHRSHRACFRPRRSVWRRSTQIAACTCARSGSRWTRATPCSPARRPPQRRHGKLRAAPARRVALPCSTQLTPTLRSTSYAPTPAPTQLQPSSRPAPAQLPPSSHPAPTQLPPIPSQVRHHGGLHPAGGARGGGRRLGRPGGPELRARVGPNVHLPRPSAGCGAPLTAHRARLSPRPSGRHPRPAAVGSARRVLDRGGGAAAAAARRPHRQRQLQQLRGSLWHGGLRHRLVWPRMRLGAHQAGMPHRARTPG